MDILKSGRSDSRTSLVKAEESLSQSTRNDDDIKTVIILVPQLLVRDLIGRKGSNLMRITKIARVSRVTLLDPILDNGVRQARIVGRPSSVKKAISLIDCFCEDKMPGYKARYGLSDEGHSQYKEEDIVLDGDETVDPKMTNAPPENSVDPLLAFLLSQKASLKGSPHDFYEWLLREDVVSLAELAEAVEDDDFVRQQMQANGLKVC